MEIKFHKFRVTFRNKHGRELDAFEVSTTEEIRLAVIRMAILTENLEAGDRWTIERNDHV